MAADPVEGQCGAGLVHVHDLTEGDKAQFNEGLEAVADAQHQAVPVFEQVVDRVFDPRVAEEGGDELAGAIGFVAAGEAAGDGDDLGLVDQLLKGGNRFLDILGGEVFDHKGGGAAAGPFKGFGGVVLAVGAGEYRDQHPGFGDL